MRIELIGYLLDIDRTATVRAYSAAHFDCVCAYCENFRAAYFYLPQIFLDALYQMGADPSRPTGTTEINANPDNTHYYHAWYHVAGKIITKPNPKRDRFRKSVATNSDPFGITNNRNLLPDNFPEPVIEVEIWGNLPWMISPLENS